MRTTFIVKIHNVSKRNIFSRCCNSVLLENNINRITVIYCDILQLDRFIILFLYFIRIFICYGRNKLNYKNNNNTFDCNNIYYIIEAKHIFC